MKIGITCYPTYGGSGTLATELGLELARRGHEIHFISYALPFRLTAFHQNVYFHEVEVTGYPLFEYPPYSLALAVKMYDVIKNFKLELMHVHYAIPHATCAWIAREMLDGKDIKLITTLHGTDITLVGQEESFFSITEFSMEKSDAVTAVSDFLAQRTGEIFKVATEIQVIKNFVNTDTFDRDRYYCWRDKFASKNEKVIMHISNFRPVKRVLDVVKIFAGIRSELPAKLVMVGDGPDYSIAVKLSKELGIAKDCHFLGRQESVAELLSCADLFLLPSEAESFGLTALEAMSCKVPVIGTDSGGLPEVVNQGETGFLAPIGDVQRMSEDSINLLTNEGMYKEFRENCRIRAVECFSMSRIIPQYESLYDDVSSI